MSIVGGAPAMMDTSGLSRKTMADTVNRVLGEIDKGDGQTRLMDYSELNRRQREEASAIIAAAPMAKGRRRFKLPEAEPEVSAAIPSIMRAAEEQPVVRAATAAVAPELPKIPVKAKAEEEEEEEAPAAPAAAGELTVKDVVPPLVKALKVGDIIILSRAGYYMGDGGDSRDARGYSFRTKITKVMAGHTKFKVKSEGVIGGVYDSDEYDVTLSIYGGRLMFTGRKDKYSSFTASIPGARYDGLYRNKEEFDVDEAKIMKAQSAAFKKSEATRLAKAKKVMEKPLEEQPRAALVRLAEKYATEKGVRVRGLTTASKETLIKFLREKGIAE